MDIDIIYYSFEGSSVYLFSHISEDLVLIYPHGNPPSLACCNYRPGLRLCFLLGFGCLFKFSMYFHIPGFLYSDRE